MNTQPQLYPMTRGHNDRVFVRKQDCPCFEHATQHPFVTGPFKLSVTSLNEPDRHALVQLTCSHGATKAADLKPGSAEWALLMAAVGLAWQGTA
jgi:hypothetical protein